MTERKNIAAYIKIFPPKYETFTAEYCKMEIFKIPTEKKSLDITLAWDSEIFDNKESDVLRYSFLFHIESKA